jgi:hypothetical protein
MITFDWLVNVMAFKLSSLYIVQDFMPTGGDEELTCTLFSVWWILVESHIQGGSTPILKSLLPFKKRYQGIFCWPYCI